MQAANQLRSSQVSGNCVKLNELLIEDVRVPPIRNINDSILLNKYMKDYLLLKNIRNERLSEFDSFCWPAVIRGLSLFAMPKKYTVNSECSRKTIISKEYLDQNKTDDKDTSLSYLVPLISVLTDKLELEQNQELKKLDTTGYIKEYKVKATNGPLLIIVCGSCRSAQRIHELLNEMIDITHRARARDPATDRRITLKKLKTILLQGGGYEDIYDVPLTNGCDILICSTPFCLLRMLGHKKTNLERLQHMVFDEAYLLVERFYKQISTLMMCYADVLQVSSNLTRAQFLVFSSLWSSKLKRFINKYLPKLSMLTDNKLEASYYGQTHHVVDECGCESITKLKKIPKILKACVEEDKNTVIFVADDQTSTHIRDILVNKLNFANVNILTEQTNNAKINELEKKWESWHLADKSHLIEKRLNTNLILILSDSCARFININNAKCIIHYSFPTSKAWLGSRLWFMRSHFTGKKQTEKIKIHSNTNINNSFTSDSETLRIEMRDDTELVINDQDRISSFMFVTSEEIRYADSFLSFLRRTGFPEQNLPKQFIQMAKKSLEEDEASKKKYNLCHYIKSFGKCVETISSNCRFRHRLDPEIDAPRRIDENKLIPQEGYIKFKVAHVEDTNHIFVNILSHQDLKRETTTDLDTFLNFDLELQMYFSNPDHVVYNTNSFKVSELYAFKDITCALYKRIKLVKVTRLDGNVAYEVMVKCIDYGVKLIISVHDLIKLPEKFQKLPPQAVEVFFCDIRPIDRDINYSIASKCFIASKLNKAKEFVGKIHLAAADTLWLHPVSSFKHLKEVKLAIIDDCVRLELVSNNFATNYQSHLRDLKQLFVDCGMPVSRLEDSNFNVQQSYSILIENLYENYMDHNDLTSYAFMDKQTMSQVYVTAVEKPNKFYVQNTYSFNMLERLNIDMNAMINDLTLDPAKHAEFLKRTQLIRSNLNKSVIELSKQTTNNKRFHCIARLKSENEYYRAQINDFRDSTETGLSEVQVFFVDYGDYSWVRLDDIYPMSDKFIRVLPFQAIECTLGGIESTENGAKWTDEQGDKLWLITHDSENLHHFIYSEVISETKAGDHCLSSKCFEMKRKTYSVRLFKKTAYLPILIDIAHELVTVNCGVRLTTEEENIIFTIVDKTKGPFGPIAKQFVIYFIQGHNEQKQLEFVRLLESRSSMMRCIESEEMLATGLIQTIGQSLFFIFNKPTVLINLLKFIRKNFIRNEIYLKEFILNNGMNHLIFILNECDCMPQELKELVLNVLDEAAELNVFKKKALEEEYLRSIWCYLLNKSCRTQNEESKVVNLLEKLWIDIELNKPLYTNDLAKLIEKYENKLGSNELSQKYLNYIRHINGPEMKDIHEDENNEEKVENEEDKEKLRRVLDFIHATSKNDICSVPAIKQNESYEVTPPNSSEDEVEAQFLDDLAKLLLTAQNKPRIHPEPLHQDEEFGLFQNKPYKHPMIEWNQNKKQISIKVFLANAKELTVSYGTQTVIFRTRLNEIDYGFDFELFDQIDEEKCRFATENKNYIMIYLQKKSQTEWPRLLHTFYKPKFIKSVYNNIRNTSSEEEEVEDEIDSENKKPKKKNKKKKIDFDSILGDRRPIKHTGNYRLSSSESNSTDSESDFDGHAYNDVADSKDIFWD